MLVQRTLVRYVLASSMPVPHMVAGKIMNIPDTYAHPLFNSRIDRSTGFRTRSMLCCPITDHTNKSVAVLQVWARSSLVIADHTVHFLKKWIKFRSLSREWLVQGPGADGSNICFKAILSTRYTGVY